MYARARNEIAEAISRRNIDRIVYFHCDHFEPWRNVYKSVSEHNVAHIHHFADETAKIDFARRLTLFYRCHLKPTIKDCAGAVFAEDVPLGFVRPKPSAMELAGPAIRRLAHDTQHELQLHIHHEYVTTNDRYYLLSKWPQEFFETNTKAMDRRRFALLVDLSIETVQRQADIVLDKWFFVHGNWALNASDAEVCTISNELEMLRERACLGDFTFPAGPPREACTPRFKFPAFVRPFDAERCYDQPAADLKSAHGAAELARDPNRFFIWSSPLDWQFASLDYFTDEVQHCCLDPAAWARHLACNALVADGTAYVHTSAHSMNLRYTDERGTVFPHAYPPINSMFGILFDAATQANAKIEFLTVSEVYERFTGSQS